MKRTKPHKESSLTELSLFSGAGGGLLASRLLGWRTVGYCEFNPYCQDVITQRIQDGLLDEAPIFSDVRSLSKETINQCRAVAKEDTAEATGNIDVVSGGFP